MRPDPFDDERFDGELDDARYAALLAVETDEDGDEGPVPTRARSYSREHGWFMDYRIGRRAA